MFILAMCICMQVTLYHIVKPFTIAIIIMAAANEVIYLELCISITFPELIEQKHRIADRMTQ